MFTLEHWTEADYAAFQGHLSAISEEKYREFNRKITADPVREMYGVRIPVLRKIAREIARGNWREFLAVSTGDKVEEVMTEGMVIALSRADYAERNEMYRVFCPKITDWAICDVVCSTEKDNGHIEDVIRFTQSTQPFTVRFGLVRLLSCYVDAGHIDRVLEVAAGISDPHYYVSMANAWLVSVCYVKFREKTEKILAALPEDTLKRAKQKIRDSYRVSKTDKQNL